MTFCESLITNILIIFNFFVAITGLALIGIGTVAQINATPYLNSLGSQYANIPIFIIVVGVLIFVIAFFGCIGAKQKNRCMLRTYAAFLIIICLIEIGAGIAIYVLKGVLKDELISNIFDNFNVTEFGRVTQTWDLMQHELSCCGVEGKLRVSIIYEPLPHSVRDASTCRTRKRDLFGSSFGQIQEWKDVRTPSGQQVEDMMTLSGHQVEDVITPSGHQVEDVMTLSGHHVEYVRTPSGQQVDDMMTLSGHQVEDVITPSGHHVEDEMTLSGHQVEYVRTPSGQQVEGCEDTSKCQKGCLQNIEHQLRSNIAIFGGIAIGICAIQLFAIVFACVILTNSKDNLIVYL